MSDSSVRTTIVLPAETARKLKELVPARKRSEFAAEAIEALLGEMQFRESREASFGAWKDKDYPHLRTQNDVRGYIAGLRDSSRWRGPTKKGR